MSSYRPAMPGVILAFVLASLVGVGHTARAQDEAPAAAEVAEPEAAEPEAAEPEAAEPEAAEGAEPEAVEPAAAEPEAAEGAEPEAVEPAAAEPEAAEPAAAAPEAVEPAAAAPEAAEGAEPEAVEPAAAEGDEPDAAPTEGEPPPPPAGVEVVDVDNDSGGALDISWTMPEGVTVYTFEVFSTTEDPATAADGSDEAWESLGVLALTERAMVFNGAVRDQPYWVKVVVTGPGGSSASEVVGPVAPTAQWLKKDKWPVFLLGLVICLAVIYFIAVARRGKKLFIRKLAGLDAVDEAIGRATEMGRPILLVPGIGDMDNVQTLAALTIMGHTAKMVAEYDTSLNVPVSRSLVMTAGRETIKQAFTEAGRPDAYNDNMVHYITDAQFGYVAGVNGIIVRDQPATCIYVGAFYAESLILAETGNAAGAIQIAGTAMPSQLPFFVAACDYTLIGEELFAASAYLSNDPKQLGSLKGQDLGKLVAMVAILLGAVFATAHAFTDAAVFESLLDAMRMFFSES